MKSPQWSKTSKWGVYFDKEDFGIEICLHSERHVDGVESCDPHLRSLAPRIWNTYLVFSDFKRWTPKVYIIHNPVVDWIQKQHGDTLDSGMLDELPWHGGITFYECQVDGDGRRVIRVGDDYHHLEDEDYHAYYTLAYMQNAAFELASACAKLLRREKVIK